MNVELTIQALFDSFPTLFIERADCLNHLFCAIGNGFAWQGGELVYCDYTEKEMETFEKHLVNGKAYQHNKMTLRDVSRSYAEERIAKKKFLFADNEIDERRITEKRLLEIPECYYKHPRNERWYFYYPDGTIHYCKQFAYLFNFPEDIKPDWMDAIEETKSLLREDGYLDI